MDKHIFVNAMEGYIDQRKKAVETIEKLYDLFGFGAYELFDNNTYEVLFINTVSDAIGDKAGWLSYFVWECECDFNEFNERVTVSNEHPNIKDFKDLYEFINPKN